MCSLVDLPPSTTQVHSATGDLDMMEGWKCERCTYSNQILDIRCEVCDTPRVFSEPPEIEHDGEVHARSSDTESDTDDVPEDGVDVWSCPACTFDNSLSSTLCEQCLSARPVAQSYGAESSNGWSCSQCTFINAESENRCIQCFFPRNYVEAVDLDLQYPLEQERRLILIGRTGSGKSATGNCILNREAFISEVATSSVTRKCKRGSADRFGKKLLVVDTPGLFDTGMDNQTVTTEILKCVGVAAPGPHAILLIIGMGRFTKEERETVELLQKAFGNDMQRYLIVVFTRKDDIDRQGKSIDDIVSSAPNPLRQILSTCQNRYLAWNNNATEEEKEAQTRQLLDMIEDMVDKNGGEYYHSTIFDAAETVIIQREKEIRKEYETESRQQLRLMRRQLSTEYREVLEDYQVREEALRRKLHSLQQQSEKENKAVHQQLTNLREEMDQYTRSMCDCEEENSLKLNSLKRKIKEVQENLRDIKEQQKELRTKAEQDCIEKENEFDDYLSALNIREDVRDEIEKGSKTILAKFMDRLRGFGNTIRDNFRSIYAALKSKISKK